MGASVRGNRNTAGHHTSDNITSEEPLISHHHHNCTANNIDKRIPGEECHRCHKYPSQILLHFVENMVYKSGRVPGHTTARNLQAVAIFARLTKSSMLLWTAEGITCHNERPSRHVPRL